MIVALKNKQFVSFFHPRKQNWKVDVTRKVSLGFVNREMQSLQGQLRTVIPATENIAVEMFCHKLPQKLLLWSRDSAVRPQPSSSALPQQDCRYNAQIN